MAGLSGSLRVSRSIFLQKFKIKRPHEAQRGCCEGESHPLTPSERMTTFSIFNFQLSIFNPLIPHFFENCSHFVLMMIVNSPFEVKYTRFSKKNVKKTFFLKKNYIFSH